MPESDPPPRQPSEPVLRSVDRVDATTSEFEGFYRDTAVPLVRFLLMQGARPADAAEAAQEALAAAYTHWHTIDTPKAWTYRVASRAWIRKAVSLNEELTAEPITPSPLLRAIPTEAWHRRHELVTALAALPPRQRQVMAWTLSGYTPAEIAAELDLPSDQVRANLALARRTLAAALTDEEDTP